ncbi:MAG: hypothetical protein ABI862_11495 [Ilumatobacteraceae bacterium]
MPTFKGNKGNLLQHWVLCELVLMLREQTPPGARLVVVDAHAMSPFATRSPDVAANVFDAVRARLPGQESAYERTWLDMVGQLDGRRVEYPTTAMFVRRLWPGPLNMVLCDVDETTIADIRYWKKDVPDSDAIEPFWGDWRDRLRRECADAAATLVSFDPYMILPENASAVKPGIMYLADLVRAAAALSHIPNGPVVVQLSTYSAQNATQDDVREVVEWIMRAVGFELVATIRAGRDSLDMMSMVLTRGLHGRPDHLNERFNTWLEGVGVTPNRPPRSTGSRNP